MKTFNKKTDILIKIILLYLIYYFLNMCYNNENNKNFAKIILKTEHNINIKGGIYWDGVILNKLMDNSQIVSQNRAKYKSYINIFIESINDNLFDSAKVNLFFINHDLSFDHYDSLYKLQETDWIICKSNLAYQLLQNEKNKNNKIKCGIYKLGFTSISKYDPKYLNKKNYKKFFHLGGKSYMKNTLLLIQTFIDYPQLGNIDIICSGLCMKQGDVENKGLQKLNYEKNEWKKLLFKINNDSVLKSRIKIYQKLEDLKKDDGNQYESLNEIFMIYGTHICPSEIEGWGHYIHELYT